MTSILKHLYTFLYTFLRPVLTEAKKAGETHFILESDSENLDEILRQAQQVGIMSDTHNYIITDLDFQTLDLQPYQWGGSNITGLRMLDPEDEDIIEVKSFINRLY